MRFKASRSRRSWGCFWGVGSLVMFLGYEKAGG
jgi:hypothetical protein